MLHQIIHRQVFLSVWEIDNPHETYRVIMYKYTTLGHGFLKNGNMFMNKWKSVLNMTQRKRRHEHAYTFLFMTLINIRVKLTLTAK